MSRRVKGSDDHGERILSKCPYCGKFVYSLKMKVRDDFVIICSDCNKSFPIDRGQSKPLTLFGRILARYQSSAARYLVFIGCFASCVMLIWWRDSEFPSQAEDSWKRIASALDATGDQPKSLLLLYAPDDASTCRCLKRKLAGIHGKRAGVDDGDVTFAAPDAADYGTVLQHYKPLIKKPGVLTVDLNRVSGSMARVFHFLTDEASLEGNPALLIYTLRDAAEDRIGKASTRAEALVKAAWNELPENEINPLVSRVVKNVVLVRSEKDKSDCTASPTT